MNWINAAAVEYAKLNGRSQPNDSDKKAAAALFERNNQRRIKAGLKPVRN